MFNKLDAKLNALIDVLNEVINIQSNLYMIDNQCLSDRYIEDNFSDEQKRIINSKLYLIDDLLNSVIE